MNPFDQAGTASAREALGGGGLEDGMELVSGWGNTPVTASHVVRPTSEAELVKSGLDAGPRGVIARGLGRAYGDQPPEKLQHIAPAGTPEEVAARLQAYVNAGARHIIVAPAAPEDTLEVVTLAAEEVLPRLVLPS